MVADPSRLLPTLAQTVLPSRSYYMVIIAKKLFLAQDSNGVHSDRRVLDEQPRVGDRKKCGLDVEPLGPLGDGTNRVSHSEYEIGQHGRS